jgi:hypothetical protein
MGDAENPYKRVGKGCNSRPACRERWVVKDCITMLLYKQPITREEMGKLGKILRAILPKDTKITFNEEKIDIFASYISYEGNSITRDKEKIVIFTVSRFEGALLLERLPIQETFFFNGERSERYPDEDPTVSDLLKNHVDSDSIVAYVLYREHVWEDYWSINTSKEAEILLP